MSRKRPKRQEPYAQLLRYLVCDVCTAMLNILLYALLYKAVGLSNVWSRVLAWFAAVVCAFIGNKYLVFALLTPARPLG